LAGLLARVMPAVLKELMRHASIDTTMKYYTGHGVAAMEDAAWAALERVNTFVNSRSADVHQTDLTPADTK